MSTTKLWLILGPPTIQDKNTSNKIKKNMTVFHKSYIDKIRRMSQ